MLKICARIRFGAGRSCEFRGGGIVEEPWEGPIDAGKVTHEKQRSGRGIGIAPEGDPIEETAEVDELFLDRGARQRLAGPCRWMDRDPRFELFDVVTFELRAAGDVRVVFGDPGAEHSEVLFDAFHR